MPIKIAPAATAGNNSFLDKDTEYDLAIRWRDQRDYAARDQIVLAFQPLVHSKAKSWAASYGRDADDLIGDAQIGLLKAVDKFDPDRVSEFTGLKVRFGTVATFWIDAEIRLTCSKPAAGMTPGRSEARRPFLFELDASVSSDPDDGDLDGHDVAADPDGLSETDFNNALDIDKTHARVLSVVLDDRERRIAKGYIAKEPAKQIAAELGITRQGCDYIWRGLQKRANFAAPKRPRYEVVDRRVRVPLRRRPDFAAVAKEPCNCCGTVWLDCPEYGARIEFPCPRDHGIKRPYKWWGATAAPTSFSLWPVACLSGGDRPTWFAWSDRPPSELPRNLSNLSNISHISQIEPAWFAAQQWPSEYVSFRTERRPEIILGSAKMPLVQSRWAAAHVSFHTGLQRRRVNGRLRIFIPDYKVERRANLRLHGVAADMARLDAPATHQYRSWQWKAGSTNSKPRWMPRRRNHAANRELLRSLGADGDTPLGRTPFVAEKLKDNVVFLVTRAERRAA